MKQMVLRFIQRWCVDTVAVLAAVGLFAALKWRGIRVDTWTHVLLASLVLGIVNTFVRPILMLLTLPLIFVTLGLFIFVINALMLLLVGKIIPGFYVDGIGSALAGALIITGVTIFCEKVLPRSQGNRGRANQRSGFSRRPPPPGKGPIIDV